MQEIETELLFIKPVNAKPGIPRENPVRREVPEISDPTILPRIPVEAPTPSPTQPKVEPRVPVPAK